MDKPKSYIEWHSSLQGFEGLRHANCCKISYEAGQQSRQAEINQLQSQINEMAEVGLGQESALREKDKRIALLQAKVDAVERVLGCAMIAPKEVFQYADRIGRALRGGHE